MARFNPWLAALAGAAIALPTAHAQDSTRPWRLGEAADLPEGVRVEGSVRGRYEALGNPFVAGRTDDDELLSVQTLLAGEVDLGGTGLTLGAEILDSRFIAGNKSGGAGSEIDTLEPIQAYLSWRPRDFLGAGAELNVTAGRFTMDVGSRRVVARANYRNIISSFDGARAVWTSPAGVTVTLASVAPVSREPNDAASALDNEVALNSNQDNVRFGIAHVEAGLGGSIKGELYLMDFDEDDSSDADTRNRDLSTVGIRAFRGPDAGEFDFDFEYARQTGSVRSSTNPADTVSLDHEAHMAHAEVGFSFAGPWSPRLALQYDDVSGDRSPFDAESQRFDSLFGDRSFELGPTSLYGLIARNNLSSPGIRLEVEPDDGSDAYIMVRGINLESARDSFANTNVRDPSGASGDDVGVQIEGRYRRWLVEDSLRLSLGAATLLQGDFMERAPNATGFGDPLYGYTELNWTF